MNIIPKDRTNAPVVYAIDRTLSMSTPDCPDGLSRWKYALGAVREAMNELARQGRRVTLMTFGRDTWLKENAAPSDVDALRMGDASCCTGQAALEACFYASDPEIGTAIIISDGLPDGDTSLGQLFLQQRALFEHSVSMYFLTVGAVSEELRVFAESWARSARLEDCLARDATSAPAVDPVADTVPPEPIESKPRSSKRR